VRKEESAVHVDVAEHPLLLAMEHGRGRGRHCRGDLEVRDTLDFKRDETLSGLQTMAELPLVPCAPCVELPSQVCSACMGVADGDCLDSEVIESVKCLWDPEPKFIPLPQQPKLIPIYPKGIGHPIIGQEKCTALTTSHAVYLKILEL
jgi:hypothetical protein